MSQSNDEEDQLNLKSTYGGLLFGVPSQGMDVGAMAAMIENLPSYYTLEILNSQLGHQLRNRQQEDFRKAFPFKDSRIIQFYELRKSRTAQQVNMTL
jgi:hypothetical protein